MNSFKLELKRVETSDTRKIEGIEFSGICFLDVVVDGASLFERDEFAGSFAILEELEKSTKATGDFLLFTSVSGIADDAGWELVTVDLQTENATWSFRRDDARFGFQFLTPVYLDEISRARYAASNCELDLEPKYVIFPE